MTRKSRAAFVHIKGLLAKSFELVIMNEEDPLILYTESFRKGIWRFLNAAAKLNRKNSDFCIIHPIGSGYSLGNHGPGTLCIRQLCQATWSLFIGKAFNSSYRP